MQDNKLSKEQKEGKDRVKCFSVCMEVKGVKRKARTIYAAWGFFWQLYAVHIRDIN